MTNILFNIDNALEFAEAAGESCALKEDYDNAWKIALLIAE